MWFKNQVYARFGDQFCTAPFCGPCNGFSGYVNTSALKISWLAVLFCNLFAIMMAKL
jgi:hypothetical protein